MPDPKDIVCADGGGRVERCLAKYGMILSPETEARLDEQQKLIEQAALLKDALLKDALDVCEWYYEIFHDIEELGELMSPKHKEYVDKARDILTRAGRTP